MALLETLRSTLMPLAEPDFSDIVSMYTEPKTLRFMTGFRDKTASELRSFLVEKLHRNSEADWPEFWVARERTTDKFIGTGSINRHSELNLVQIGGVVRSAFWNDGFATEVGRGLVEYGLNELDLNEVYAVVEKANAPARRVAEKLGFKFQRIESLDGEDAEVYRLHRD